MKKTVRFLLILVAVIIGILLILTLVEPHDMTLTRTILIKAPKEEVFEQMVKFKNWPHWSPWEDLDTAMKRSYSGTDGTPGSSYSWVSENKDVGAGTMTNKTVTGTQMDIELAILKPFKITSDIALKAEDTAGMTRASWTFSNHMPFPFNAMLAFIDMKKKLGADFDLGLSRMQKYVESHTAQVDIREVDYPAHIFEGVRQTVSWNDITRSFGEAYDMVKKDAAGKINGSAAGIFYTWDTVNKKTDMLAALPVSDSTMPVKGATFTYLGPAKAYMAVQKGGYSNEMQLHAALSRRVKSMGKKQALVIEEYLVGPKTEPDSTKWVTKIYYLVQ